MDCLPRLRVCVLGLRGAGKSSLLNVLLQGPFLPTQCGGGGGDAIVAVAHSCDPADRCGRLFWRHRVIAEGSGDVCSRIRSLSRSEVDSGFPSDAGPSDIAADGDDPSYLTLRAPLSPLLVAGSEILASKAIFYDTSTCEELNAHVLRACDVALVVVDVMGLQSTEFQRLLQ
jgi:hypothetical protein